MLNSIADLWTFTSPLGLTNLHVSFRSSPAWKLGKFEDYYDVIIVISAGMWQVKVGHSYEGVSSMASRRFTHPKIKCNWGHEIILYPSPHASLLGASQDLKLKDNLVWPLMDMLIFISFFIVPIWYVILNPVTILCAGHKPQQWVNLTVFAQNISFTYKFG
jgi:hypothetical protein